MAYLKSTLLLIALALLCLPACQNPQKTSSPEITLARDSCPLSYKIDWIVVEKGVSADKQIELLTKLSAAAKADADAMGKLLANGSANVNLENELALSKTIKSDEFRKAEISQQLFEEYQKIAVASCNIWDGITHGLYGNDEESLKKARELFTNMQESFAGLQKKNLSQK